MIGTGFCVISGVSVISQGEIGLAALLIVLVLVRAHVYVLYMDLDARDPV